MCVFFPSSLDSINYFQVAREFSNQFTSQRCFYFLQLFSMYLTSKFQLLNDEKKINWMKIMTKHIAIDIPKNIFCQSANPNDVLYNTLVCISALSSYSHKNYMKISSFFFKLHQIDWIYYLRLGNSNQFNEKTGSIEH